jgi:hypothetical protein
MQKEKLYELEHKLKSSVFTEEDEWRLNELTERYDKIFEEMVEHYLLDDMPHVHEKIKEVLQVARIKEYFLHKEIIANVDRVLARAKN